MRAQLSSPCQQVDGALAYFETERSVPAFKLRQNAGRSDIMKGVSGADSDKYFQALRFRQPTSLARRCPAHAPSRCFHRGCAAPLSSMHRTPLLKLSTSDNSKKLPKFENFCPSELVCD